MYKKTFFSIFFIALLIAAPTFVWAQNDIDPDVMSVPDDENNPENNQSVAPTNYYPEPVSEARTKEECEQKKAQVLQSCKEQPPALNTLSEAEKSKKIGECEIHSSSAYSQCMQSVVDTGNVQSNTEVGYELPVGEAAQLNQFQGLTLRQVIGNAISTAMKIMGSLAFALMVFAGLLWMTAGGNSDQERKAKDMMVWAALGVIAILSSYSVVKFIFDAFA